MKVIVGTHYMPGNTGIQLAVAHILKTTLGSIETIEFLKGDTEYTNIFNFSEETWSNLYPFLGQPIPPHMPPIATSSIYLGGYFQYSEPLVKHRTSILDFFRSCDMRICSKGQTMREFMEAAAPIQPGPEDIVLHVRLGDFIGAKMVIDPAPQLAILRRALLSSQARLIIVCAKPVTALEENYLKFFEEFHPIFQHGTELEDFATLRAANRIMVSNSTFSWLAAFIGSAIQRWIPVPTYNELGVIDATTDTLYEAATGYPIEDMAIPTGPFLPVTGEFLQSLCDYTILDRAKKEEIHYTIDYAHPIERQIFTDEPWPEEVLNARSLFIYPTCDGSLVRHVFKFAWPNLRLIVFHNSDYGVDYESVIPFLEANPAVWCWAQNATQWHPRIRVVPIGEENRMWRGGSATYEPTVTMSRSEERDIEIFVPFMSITNPIRITWIEQLGLIRDTRTGIHLVPRLQKGDYLDTLVDSKAMLCAPGNGVDTHRHWDALAKGVWAIVHDSDHTRLLMRTYPSLHLLPIRGIEDLSEIVIPEGLPPFHPMLLRAFWRTLYGSYVMGA